MNFPLYFLKVGYPITKNERELYKYFSDTFNNSEKGDKRQFSDNEATGTSIPQCNSTRRSILTHAWPHRHTDPPNHQQRTSKLNYEQHKHTEIADLRVVLKIL